MARGKRHTIEKNTSSVDDNLGGQLRRELSEALPDADSMLRERLARTAILSRREALRFLDETAAERSLPEENVTRARQVIERLAHA